MLSPCATSPPTSCDCCCRSWPWCWAPRCHRLAGVHHQEHLRRTARPGHRQPLEDPRDAGVPPEAADEVLDWCRRGHPRRVRDGRCSTPTAPRTSPAAPLRGDGLIDPEQAVGSSNEMVDGRTPAADGEVVLPEGVLEGAGLAIGDTAQVYTTSNGMIDVTVVGTYTSNTDVGGYVGVGFTSEQARALFSDGEHASDVPSCRRGRRPRRCATPSRPSTRPHRQHGRGGQERLRTSSARCWTSSTTSSWRSG